jgi:hypothetical protein
MDRRTVIKGATAGVAVALLPTIPVEEPNAISFTVSGLPKDEMRDLIYFESFKGQRDLQYFRDISKYFYSKGIRYNRPWFDTGYVFESSDKSKTYIVMKFQ